MAKRGDTKPFVVKIQRALSHPGGPALVYDQRRRFTIQVPWKDVERLFRKQDLKVYAMATVDRDGVLQLEGDIVPDPGW